MRHVADQVARFTPSTPQRVKPPRPRKAVKRQEEPSPPTPFYIVTGNPSPGYEGSVAEGHFVVTGGKVQLTDAGGVPIGESRAVTRDPLFTARSLLREKISARQAGPYHGALKYPVLKY